MKFVPSYLQEEKPEVEVTKVNGVVHSTIKYPKPKQTDRDLEDEWYYEQQDDRQDL